MPGRGLVACFRAPEVGADVRKLAEEKGVDIREYKVFQDLLDDLTN